MFISNGILPQNFLNQHEQRLVKILSFQVKELTRVEPGDAMQLIKLVEVTEPTC